MVKKSILCVFVLLVMLPTAAFAQTVDVTIHYNDPDNAYDEYHAWVWIDGESVDGFDGPIYDSTTDDFGFVLQTTLNGEGEHLGVIMHSPGDKPEDNPSYWETWEFQQEVQVDITDGQVDVWLQKGSSDVYYSAEEASAAFGLDEEADEVVVPDEMPRTGLGGTSTSSHTALFTGIAVVLVTLLLATIFIRLRKQHT